MLKAFLVGLLAFFGWMFNILTALGLILIVACCALYGYGSHKFRKAEGSY